MANRISVTFEGDHVRVESYGEKSLAWTRKVFTEIVDTCEANNCFKVLGIANSTKPPGRLFQTEEEARAWLFGERGY